ncbi:MAG: 50S ribosomal protein L33 [Patescibacteria group bacterium]|jgi:large subunit ribosomal protein L33
MAETKKSGGKKKDKVIIVTMQCTECKEHNYVSKKNKINHPDRLEMNKYCKKCKKATAHKETK